jgi:CheY-like chemotaxis protein
MYDDTVPSNPSRWRKPSRLVDRIPYLSLIETPTDYFADPAPRARLSPSPGGQSGPKQVLVVDDEQGVRELLTDMLLMEGYAVVSVASGSEGILLFRQKHHDLVVTDLVMPGIKGSEVARAVKQFSPGTPVIMVTGWDIEAYESEIRNASVDRVIRKPFKLSAIIRTANELTSEQPPYNPGA